MSSPEASAEPDAPSMVDEVTCTTGPGIEQSSGRRTEFGKWISRHPVDAAAVAISLAAVVLRMIVGYPGYFFSDDWVFLANLSNEGLSGNLLASPHAGLHWIPGGYALLELALRIEGPLPWTATLVISGVMLFFACLGTWYAIRALVGPVRLALLPFAIVATSVLGLVATIWLAQSYMLLPLWIAFGFGIGLQVHYAREKTHRRLVGVVACLVGAMFFSQKSLFLIPILFLVSVCWMTRGPVWSSVVAAARRFRNEWIILLVIGGIYALAYLKVSNVNSVWPDPLLALDAYVTGFAKLFPTSITGGPWEWDGKNPAPPLLLTLLALAATIVFIGLAARFRRHALRLWTPWFVYLFMALIAITGLRIVPLGPIAGFVHNYFIDGAPLLACGLALSFLPMVGEKDYRRHPYQWATAIGRRAVLWPVAVGITAVIVGSAVWSSLGFVPAWASNPSRQYSNNFEASMIANPLTQLFDGPPPKAFGMPYPVPPWDTRAEMFKAFPLQPQWVTQTDFLQTIKEDGVVVEGTVAGTEFVKNGRKECPTAFVEKATTIPVPGNPFPWRRVLTFDYLANRDQKVKINFGEGVNEVELKAGLHSIYALIDGGGPELTMTPQESGTSLCISTMKLGEVVPK